MAREKFIREQASKAVAKFTIAKKSISERLMSHHFREYRKPIILLHKILNYKRGNLHT